MTSASDKSKKTEISKSLNMWRDMGGRRRNVEEEGTTIQMPSKDSVSIQKRGPIQTKSESFRLPLELSTVS
jgi:hypothetical protein